MLRSIFVLILVAIGAYYALQAPFYALLFYVGNAYFRPEDWVWLDFVRSLKLSLLSGVFVVLFSLFSRQRFIWNGRIALLWLFLIHTFLSTLGSQNFSYSWGSWTNFFKSIIITYMIIVHVDDFAKFRLVLLVMALALGLEQARQGWFYLVTSPGWNNTNDIAFLGDNNGVAVGMLGLLPIFGLLEQTTNNKWAKRFYWFLLIGCLFRALSTYSRGGFLSAIAMGSLWLLRSRQRVGTFVCGIAILVIVLPALPDRFWTRMSTIETYAEVQDQSALGRLHFWTVAVQMANANPLLGVGCFGYIPAYNNYDFSFGKYGRARSVHSSYFGVLAELGYPGAILYFLIIFGAIHSCSWMRKRAACKDTLLDVSKSALSLQISLTAFIIGGIFFPGQYIEMLWHIIGLTIALERIFTQCVAEIQRDEFSGNVIPSALNRTRVAA